MKLCSLIVLASCTLSIGTLTGCQQKIEVAVEQYKELRRVEQELASAQSGDLLVSTEGKICMVKENPPSRQFIHISCGDGRPGWHRKHDLAMYIERVITPESALYRTASERFRSQ